MKLYTSPTSPFGRKVKISARELGLFDRLQPITQALSPLSPNETVNADNPLGKIPTLILDDGTALYDSRVICEFLDAEAGGHRLFPASGPARWRALSRQALGDGMMDAAIAVRYEQTLRPDTHRWTPWTDGQFAKVTRALADLDRQDLVAEPLDIGTITLGCALFYLDMRFADLGWRDRHPSLARFAEALASRPSFTATAA